MTDKDKARRTRMRFEIETAISNGSSAEDLEKAVDRIIAIHEANKLKPVAGCRIDNGRVVAVDWDGVNDNCPTPLYTTPPTRELLSEETIYELAEVFGEFAYGDAQGHKRIGFARAIEQAHGIGVTK